MISLRKKPDNYNNHLYLKTISEGPINELARQIRILKNFWKKHPTTQGVSEQERLDYQIAYLEYVFFWRTAILKN
jgi:hypothetical protein